MHIDLYAIRQGGLLMLTAPKLEQWAEVDTNLVYGLETSLQDGESLLWKNRGYWIEINRDTACKNDNLIFSRNVLLESNEMSSKMVKSAKPQWNINMYLSQVFGSQVFVVAPEIVENEMSF